MLPKIVDNGYKDFGCIHPKSLGSEWRNVKIATSISDQTAAMWGKQLFM